MTELVHVSAGFPVLSTLLRLGDGISHAADQLWRVWGLFYLIAVASFFSWHVLSHISAKRQIGGTPLTHFLSVFPDAVLLCLLGVYEFSARPIIKACFEEYGFRELPPSTHLLLNVVPVGSLSASFASLIILYLWAAQSRKSPKLVFAIWSTLWICGLFLLLAIPIALLMPLI
jgi:hypothetical protein